MAQSDFLDWIPDDYEDRRLKRELLDYVGSQARVANDLESQIAQIRGTLEQRVGRLEEAFYAYVELSDIRAELAVFEEEATVRHAAQRMLRGLLRDADEVPALPADLPRCRGYWLRPAAVSLWASLSGDERTAAAAMAEAQELDATRTAVFHVATFALAGQAGRGHSLLGAALQQPAEQATYAQRALWRAGANGVFGAVGEGLIRDWIAGFIRGLDSEAVAAGRVRWQEKADQEFGASFSPDGLRRRLPLGLYRLDALVSPIAAARKLSGLSAWVQEAATGEPAPATAAPDPAASRSALLDSATSRSAAPGATPSGSGTPADSPRAGLAAVAAALTEEGSQDEISLTRRARKLREVIDARKAVARPSWDDPQEAMVSLLRADAFGTDLTLRRLALASCADWVTSFTAQLAATAATLPPDEIEVTIDRHPVRLSTSGQASLDAANAEIAAEYAPQNVSDKLFGKKHAAEETAREQDNLARAASAAATALAAHTSDIRTAGRRAAADRDAIAQALASM